MEFICPTCKSTILPSNINIKSDLAKCDRCDSIHKASDLADSKSIDRINNPPVGSKIKVNKGFDGSIEVFLPNKGFKIHMIFSMFFTVFWLGFIGFWTFMALKGSVLFALFSIPFWIVGAGMVSGLINSLSETQTVIVTRASLILKKVRPIRPKTIEFRLDEIHSIKLKNFNMNSPFSFFANFNIMYKMKKSLGMGGIEMPAILTGVHTEYFFEDANDAEQEWVTSVVDNLVKMKK